MRMIFVNLPVKSIEVSRNFFTVLGFSFNPEYSDDRTLCMIVEENIFVMLLQKSVFAISSTVRLPTPKAAPRC